MKTAFLICLCSLATFALNGKHRYGFGCVAVFNPLGDGRYTKALFYTKVIDLDSLCRNASLAQKMTRKSKRYFEYTGHWVIETIKVKQNGVIREDSEIDNFCQIERSPRFRNIKSSNRTFKRGLRKMNAKHKTEFMDREKRRQFEKTILRLHTAMSTQL